MKQTFFKSPINYTGNKYRIIKNILPLLPKDINTFADIFGGSGTVLLNVSAKHYFYNDINTRVSEMFKGLMTTDTEELLARIDSTIKEYGLSKTNQEGYLKLREDYNNGKNDWLTLYVLCCYAFNSQGRFNKYGKFNMPFGKNRSQFSEIQRANITALPFVVAHDNTEFHNENFRNIDYSAFTNQDVLYFDPPYWGSDAVYNEQGGWTEDDEKFLYETLLSLNKLGVKWLLSNNLKYGNKYLEELCEKFNVYHIGTQYSNSSYHKKDRTEDDEIIITNYVNTILS